MEIIRITIALWSYISIIFAVFTYFHIIYSIAINDDRTKSFVEALTDCRNKGVQLVVCIVPSRLKDRYDAIKKTCCLTLGS